MFTRTPYTGSPVSEKPYFGGLSMDHEASGRVAQVGMHAHYHKVSVLADVLLALGAIVRSRY